MIDLIFDTETTGFPFWKAPANDPRQPHLVQLAVIVAKGDELLLKWDTIVKCPIEIPEGAANVHGITTARSQEEGVELEEALKKFTRLLFEVDRVVAHNYNFDSKIMSYAYCRADPVSLMYFTRLPHVCTMQTATPVLKLAGKRGYKWPKMMEAYELLVDSAGLSDAHTADADTMACWKVLRALEKKGVELKS